MAEQARELVNACLLSVTRVRVDGVDGHLHPGSKGTFDDHLRDAMRSNKLLFVFVDQDENTIVSALRRDQLSLVISEATAQKIQKILETPSTCKGRVGVVAKCGGVVVYDELLPEDFEKVRLNAGK